MPASWQLQTQTSNCGSSSIGGFWMAMETCWYDPSGECFLALTLATTAAADLYNRRHCCCEAL